MFRYFLFSLCLLINLNLRAQPATYNWYFGVNAALNFSSGSPVALSNSMMQAVEGCATLSDNNGDLLFYTEGNMVWAANHNLMPNGTGLNGSLTCSQSALIVPHPGNSSQYYIFTPPDQFNASPFSYSIVDMTLNNGLGDVTIKNSPLFSPSTEKVTAVRHADGVSIWVIGHAFNSADFYAYEITTLGINAPVISTSGTVHGGSNQNNIGIMKASPCGDKLALTIFDDAIVEVFDFDNFSGVVSNAVQLGTFTQGNAWGLYGLEFSPAGSRLYVTQERPAILVQYDIWAGSPSAMIASADTIVALPLLETFASMQLAPDGKIYISRFTETFLAAINNPDGLGTSCNFADQVVSFSQGTAAHGLPNFVSSYFCEQSTGIIETDERLVIYPTPVSEVLFIVSDKLFSEGEVSIRMMNITGQVFSFSDLKRINGTTISINLEQLASGMYVIEIFNGRDRIIRKLFKT